VFNNIALRQADRRNCSRTLPWS